MNSPFNDGQSETDFEIGSGYHRCIYKKTQRPRKRLCMVGKSGNICEQGRAVGLWPSGPASFACVSCTAAWGIFLNTTCCRSSVWPAAGPQSWSVPGASPHPTSPVWLTTAHDWHFLYQSLNPFGNRSHMFPLHQHIGIFLVVFWTMRYCVQCTIWFPWSLGLLLLDKFSVVFWFFFFPFLLPHLKSSHTAILFSPLQNIKLSLRKDLMALFTLGSKFPFKVSFLLSSHESFHCS